MIAVDTSVLSLVLRRRRAHERAQHPAAAHFVRALRDGLVLALPGVCVQEVLSGVRTPEQFERLRALLAPFPVLLASRAAHVAAARVANACRAGGVAAGPVDALIAALTLEHGATLLTTDEDFSRIARHCELRLEAY